MTWGADDRAVSTLVGAVVIFAFAFLFLALWQSQVVPQQNAEIEFNHHQSVQEDLINVRSAILTAPGSNGVPSVTVDMAPSYPARTLFFNPTPPQATLRTAGTSDSTVALTVDNATVSDDEVADFWSGSSRSYNTGTLEYAPGYNVYTDAPVTVYDNTRLYNRHEQDVTITVAEQAMIDGNTITLIAINGSLARNQARPYSLDLSTLSESDRALTVMNDSDGPITITFPSRLNASRWNDSFAETEELVSQGGNIAEVRSTGSINDFSLITVEFEPDTTYTLRMAKVGFGQDTTAPMAAYVIDVSGNGQSVATGDTHELVVEVRDRFNNPVRGAAVRNHSSTTLNGGSLDSDVLSTDDDGRATFVFTPGSTGTASITFNISDDATVTDAELVTFDVDVTAGEPSPPSLTTLNRDSTNSSCPQGDCFGTVTFDYTVSDESEVTNVTIRLTDKDGVELAERIETIGSPSASGIIQIDIETEEIPEGQDVAYEVVVFDDAGNTETDTGLVPKP